MIQGILVAAVSALIYLEGRCGGQHMLDRPIIIGPVVGLIMGDLTTGIIVGGELELVWMGLVGIGTATPPDVLVGSALATALTIKTNAGYETTLAMAIPISLLAQLASITQVATWNTFMAHRAEACAEKGDYRGVEISHWLGSLGYFVLKFVLIFAGYMVGPDIITAMVERIPAIIQTGLSRASGLLPALGIAMLVQLTWDRKYGVFLFLGFALSTFLGVSTIGAAVFGLIAAVLYYTLSGKKAVAPASDESEEL
jgi:PTS system mannose-specific IIC component/fructoselysine and glucoselysine-specific PTS system IIC component